MTRNTRQIMEKQGSNSTECPTQETKNPMNKVANFNGKSCRMCGKQFQHMENYRHHVILHNFGRKTNNKSIFEKYLRFFMKYHKNTHLLRGKKKYQILCADTFIQLQELRKHYRKSFTDKTPVATITMRKTQLLRCCVCQKPHSSPLSRQLHTAHHRKLQCKHCNREFTSRRLLSWHMKRHCFRSPIGSKRSETASDVSDNGVKNMCSICKKCFSSKSCLNRHQRVHTGEKPYACDLCGERFKERALVKKHMVSHTGIPLPKNHKCSFCGKGFTRSSVLQLHLKGHGKKTLECSYCGKKFPHERHLNRHLVTHEGSRKFQCDKCDKKFLTKTNLQRHVRTHTGERPFKCTWCGKKFGQSGNLKIHERVHTEEKPYQCMTCGRKFSQSANLKHHLLLHEGKVARRCKLCNKDFMDLNALQQHELMFHTKPIATDCRISERVVTLSDVTAAQSASKTPSTIFTGINLINQAMATPNLCRERFNTSDYLHRLQLPHVDCNNDVAARLSEQSQLSSHRYRDSIDPIQDISTAFNMVGDLDSSSLIMYGSTQCSSDTAIQKTAKSVDPSSSFVTSSQPFLPGLIIQSDQILSSSDLPF